jgi:hypothetical protein
MPRRVLSTLTTVAIAGAIGFGAGVYATPPDKADEFRALVNSKVDEVNGLIQRIQRERTAIEPKAKAPSQATAPIAPEVAPKEIPSEVPVQPASEAPAADAEWQKEMPDANAAPSSTGPAESSNSQSAPAPGAEPVATVTSSTPATPTNTENVEQPKPVAKPHPKPPVKKPKPKPKPAEHHPKAAPAEQAPAAEEPVQQ